MGHRWAYYQISQGLRGKHQRATTRVRPYRLTENKYMPLQFKQNNMRRLLNEGKRVFGAWLLIPSTITVEIAGWAGLDFCVIDNEHGWFNDETVGEMIRAAENVGISLIV